MAENTINAHCRICGRGYHVCNSCLAQKSIKPWRTITDSMEHYKIYFVLHSYTTSKDRESAKKELQHCDLSDLEYFKPEVQAAIREIMAEPQEAQTSFSTINNPIKRK